MTQETTPIHAPFPDEEGAVLRLRLGACRLVLRPGEAEPWIDGTYRDPSGEEPLRLHVDGPELTLRQRHTVASTVGLVHGTPVCELSLGTAKPYRLVLDTGASDVTLELGGLPLVGIDLSAGAGRVELTVDRANPVDAVELSFRLGAGTLSARGLGNLAAERLRVEGGAASLDLDLTGELRRPLEARISTGMAAVTVTVPADRPVRLTSDARLGGLDIGDGFLTREGAITTPADGEPVISLHALVALGQLRLRTRAAE
jgi:hypothetical protein